ncbi:MAG: hypothetical protein NT028_00015, partial [candidate division Zixibacteria bacterium]|nr:hypothetical protein [candidate division Zixibacteria bacterium]
GEGLKPVGYGYDSVEASILSALQVNAAGSDLAARQKVIRQIDARGIVATPANSSINELVTEAVRLSIQRDGAPAVIDYGDKPAARLR